MTTIIFFVFAFIIIGVLGFFVWLGFALKQFSNNLEEKKRQYNNYTKVYYVLNKDCQVEAENLIPSVKQVFDLLLCIDEPLSCQEIADFSGLSCKQVSACLTRLRLREIVKVTFQK